MADLHLRRATEPLKIRQVVVFQTDLLNDVHTSNLICPITTDTIREAELLRVQLKKGPLDKPSDELVDQFRAIDNKRLLKRIGKLTRDQSEKLFRNIRIVPDL